MAFRPRWCASRARRYRCAPAACSPAPTDPLPLRCRARRPAAQQTAARRRSAERIWRKLASPPVGWCEYRGHTARRRTRARHALPDALTDTLPDPGPNPLQDRRVAHVVHLHQELHQEVRRRQPAPLPLQPERALRRQRVPARARDTALQRAAVPDRRRLRHVVGLGHCDGGASIQTRARAPPPGHRASQQRALVPHVREACALPAALVMATGPVPNHARSWLKPGPAKERTTASPHNDGGFTS